MISVNDGKVKLSGDFLTLAADLGMIVDTLCSAFQRDFGYTTDKSRNVIHKIVDITFSDEWQEANRREQR